MRLSCSLLVGTRPTRWTATLSSKVNWPHAIKLRSLRGKHLSRYVQNYEPTEPTNSTVWCMELTLTWPLSSDLGTCKTIRNGFRTWLAGESPSHISKCCLLARERRWTAIVPLLPPLSTCPTPYTLYPTLYTPHPTPFTLHPEPYTLHPTPYTPHPTPHTPHPTHHTLHLTPLHPTPFTLHLTPYTLKA